MATEVNLRELVRGPGQPKKRDRLHDRGWTDEMIIGVVQQHRLRGGLVKAAAALSEMAGLLVSAKTLGLMLREIAAERQSERQSEKQQ